MGGGGGNDQFSETVRDTVTTLDFQHPVWDQSPCSVVRLPPPILTTEKREYNIFKRGLFYSFFF